MSKKFQKGRGIEYGGTLAVFKGKLTGVYHTVVLPHRLSKKMKAGQFKG